MDPPNREGFSMISTRSSGEKGVPKGSPSSIKQYQWVEGALKAFLAPCSEWVEGFNP
ncbi:MAG: hypothetical protein HQL95_08855 [Magnetococcales bacterium]|nr:hypothetical protein [Magnetococcales bacterium]